MATDFTVEKMTLALILSPTKPLVLTADKAYSDASKEDHKFSVSRCYLVSSYSILNVNCVKFSSSPSCGVNYTAVPHPSRSQNIIWWFN